MESIGSYGERNKNTKAVRRPFYVGRQPDYRFVKLAFFFCPQLLYNTTARIKILPLHPPLRSTETRPVFSRTEFQSWFNSGSAIRNGVSTFVPYLWMTFSYSLESDISSLNDFHEIQILQLYYYI